MDEKGEMSIQEDAFDEFISKVRVKLVETLDVIGEKDPDALRLLAYNEEIKQQYLNEIITKCEGFYDRCEGF